MPTPPHCPATPSPYPPPHSDRTGEPSLYTFLQFLHTSSFLFILRVTSPVLVSLQTILVPRGTGILANFKFSSTIHLAIFANLFLAFSLLIGRLDILTSLTLRLCALIQKRHCLCLKTPGTVWPSNNCQYW